MTPSQAKIGKIYIGQMSYAYYLPLSKSNNVVRLLKFAHKYAETTISNWRLVEKSLSLVKNVTIVQRALVKILFTKEII